MRLSRRRATIPATTATGSGRDDRPRRSLRNSFRASTTTEAPATEQASWTGGQARLTSAIRWGMLAALACGVLALIMVVTGAGSSPTPPRSRPAPTIDIAEQSAAGDLARQLVLTWLQAARGDEATLSPLVDTDRLRLPQTQTWVASDAAIARIDTATTTPTGPTATASATPTSTSAAAPGPHAWTVTVSVTVRGVTDPPASAIRRWFQVPVVFTAGAARAAALPTPVAAPPVAAELPLGYRAHLTGTDHPISTTITQFLSAYAAGGGDVSRYLAPGTRISSITPAPYRAVTVTDIATDRDFGTPAGRATPADGATARVLVTADLAGDDTPGHTVTGQWALSLKARGGRWEITTLDPLPVLATPDPGLPTTTAAPPTTPSVSGTTTTSPATPRTTTTVPSPPATALPATPPPPAS